MPVLINKEREPVEREAPRRGAPAPGARKKLHLGCGLHTPEGWTHLDGSWNAWLAKHRLLLGALRLCGILPRHVADLNWDRRVVFHDVKKPLPFPGNTFSAVYASHLLEHLHLSEARNLLEQCYRVLQPTGVLRIVVPDLRAAVQEYLGDYCYENSAELGNTLSPADRFNQRLHFRGQGPPRGNILYRHYTLNKDFHSHKWMYDSDSLVRSFETAGFRDVGEMELHKSRITGIERIEQPGRILHGEGVCVEGVKPTQQKMVR